MKNANSKILLAPILLVSFFSLILLTQSCKDDEEPNWTRYEYLPKEVKDHVYFKTGTWWVYKRIPGGQLDTIEVYSYRSDTTVEEEDGNTLIFETITWSAKSKRDNYVYQLFRRTPSPPLSTISQNSIVQHHYSISKSKPGSSLGSVFVYHYPYTNSGAIRAFRETRELDTIQGKEFHNVKTFIVSNDATFVYDDSAPDSHIGGRVLYTFAPNAGIIKKENIDHDVSWELVESRIIQ